MNRTWKIAIALVLIFCAITSVVAATRANAAARPTPRVLISSGHFARRPADINLGGRKLSGLRWTLYNQVEGKAHGTVKLHNGHTHNAQVRVTGPTGAENNRYFHFLRLDYNAGGIHEVKFYKVTVHFKWREVG